MKTLRIFYLMLCLLVGLSSNAQNEDESSITISVVMPDNSEYLSKKAISKIESKIQHLVSRNGISGRGYTNEFLIYPKFEIFDESTLELMQNITVIEGEFNLFIQQRSNKKIFSTYHKSVKGSGASREKAIINAISKIPTNNKDVSEFINLAKERIIAYYNANCDQIVKDADTHIKTQRYNAAIATLLQIPREAKQCYSEVQDKTIEAYNAFQDKKCKQYITKAKSQLANNAYSSALQTLAFIDVNSNCSTEAQRLITTVAKKVDQNEQKAWNLMLKRYEDRQNMERYRLDIMKDIAKAYYNSKPQTVVYKSLF